MYYSKKIALKVHTSLYLTFATFIPYALPFCVNHLYGCLLFCSCFNVRMEHCHSNVKPALVFFFICSVVFMPSSIIACVMMEQVLLFINPVCLFNPIGDIWLKNIQWKSQKHIKKKSIRTNYLDRLICYSFRNHNEQQIWVTMHTVCRLCGSSKSIRGVLFSYGEWPIISLALTAKNIIIILYASCHSTESAMPKACEKRVGGWGICDSSLNTLSEMRRK